MNSTTSNARCVPLWLVILVLGNDKIDKDTFGGLKVLQQRY
jgi:hypothetical protein